MLWNGGIGGAEVFTVSLAEHANRLGAVVTLVFLEEPGHLRARLEDKSLAYVSLGLARGRDLLGHPVRFRRAVAEHGPDGALLVDCGLMGASLKAAGYRAPIVAVEHGARMAAFGRKPLRRGLWWLARLAGACADDVEVGVSEFMVRCMRRGFHARDVRLIHNGVQVPAQQPQPAAQPQTATGGLIVGFAARLVPGKGADHLLRALALLSGEDVRLRIAGEGPQRGELEALAQELGVAERVCFAGLVLDMPAFWRGCSVAVACSAEFIEACPMAPLEAMAAGRPVLASDNGGLSELLAAGVGSLLQPGDPGAIADALRRYLEDERLRASHGRAARRHVRARFEIERCAASYLALFDELGG